MDRFILVPKEVFNDRERGLICVNMGLTLLVPVFLWDDVQNQ